MIQVYKDASGMPRWVAVTSTAYRDRDGEIVSSEALKKAVAYGDSTGERGPLRFWHVPGLDIGTTDYQAITDNGRFLVESGLITNPSMAAALQEKGGNWQMSIGFNHPASQPDGDGVFKDISIFERSITPPNKAANPFTAFNVEGGKKMLTKEKLAALKELLGDTPELTNMLAKVAKTDKAAQEAGIAFKEVDVSEQDKHIAALEQRLYEMQQQLLELQTENTATAFKHYKAGSGADGYGHTHQPGDYLDYGHDTSPDMIAERQRKMQQSQKAGQMGMPMMNPYQMKGRGMMNPYQMKGRGMMNPYQMKNAGMMNPYQMKNAGMMNPYEMKAAGMMGMMDPYEMKQDDMDMMEMDMMEMGMDPYEMKGAEMGMMNPYEMKQDDMGMGGAPAAPAAPAATDMLLTAEEMTALADAVAERLIGKLEDINMKMAKVDEELKGRGYARTKEVQETTEALEKLVEHAEATQDEIDALRAMNEELLSRTEQAEQELVSLKEATMGGSRMKSSDVADILAKAEQLEMRLKELEGDQPAAVKRPSESRHNVVSSTTVKELRPSDLPPGLNDVEQGAYEFIFKK
jgi:conjugal transfer/entry exclusion protein